MVRIIRVVLAVVGVVLVLGSAALTWVDVDLDLVAIAEASEGVLDEAVDLDSETEELIDDATDVVNRARDIIPDRLVDATLDGLNAYDLLGFGFVIAGLAVGSAISTVLWAVRSIGWVRWIGLVLVILLVLSVAAVVGSVFATGSLLEAFLPEEWQQFSPSFEIRSAPLGAVAGGVLLFLSLLGRSPRREPAAPLASSPRR